MGWATWTLVVGSLASAGLLVRALVGDRSRGRRRCPKCWYDMSGTGGLACPECGKDAKRESRLFRARRRKRWVLASLLPLVAGVACWGVVFFQDPSWPARLPTPALIVASAWHSPRIWVELLGRVNRVNSGEEKMPDWQRRLAGHVSRWSVRTGDGPEVTFHMYLLTYLRENDASTMPALVALADSTDPGTLSVLPFYIERTGRFSPECAAAAEGALTKMVQHPDPMVQGEAMKSLLGVKAERPGGPAPAAVLAAAGDTASTTVVEFSRTYAVGLLGLYDASDKSREALLAGASSTHIWVRIRSVVSLTRHSPDDGRVRGLLVEALGDAELGVARDSLARWVLEGDRWFMDDDGALSAPRRALYSDEVRQAILEAEAGAAEDVPGWTVRRLLKKHPCFTEAERAGVREAPPEPTPLGKR